jgi:hypothetical protein
MFRNDLLKLSVTLVLLVATAFASVTAVAAEGSNTIIQVKAASPAVEVTADEWYKGRSDTGISANADLSDYFQRHPDTRISVVSATDLSDYFLRHPDTSIPAETVTGALAPLDWYFAHDHAVLDGDNNVVSSGKDLMDNRLAPLDWYFAHDHAVLDGDNNVVSSFSGDMAGSLKYGPPGR